MGPDASCGTGLNRTEPRRTGPARERAVTPNAVLTKQLVMVRRHRQPLADVEARLGGSAGEFRTALHASHRPRNIGSANSLPIGSHSFVRRDRARTRTG